MPVAVQFMKAAKSDDEESKQTVHKKRLVGRVLRRETDFDAVRGGI